MSQSLARPVMSEERHIKRERIFKKGSSPQRERDLTRTAQFAGSSEEEKDSTKPETREFRERRVRRQVHGGEASWLIVKYQSKRRLFRKTSRIILAMGQDRRGCWESKTSYEQSEMESMWQHMKISSEPRRAGESERMQAEEQQCKSDGEST